MLGVGGGGGGGDEFSYLHITTVTGIHNLILCHGVSKLTSQNNTDMCPL